MFSTLDIEDYNELSFVVKGDTEKYREDLKYLGGRWNTNLKGGPGWLFNKKRHGKVVSEYKKYNDRVNDYVFYTIGVTGVIAFSLILYCC